jgi:putative restriction endonuclease
MPRENWTIEQTKIALNLYCKIPFNKVSSNHPDIIKIANIIGRTPNSVKMKIGNFGSFDPELKKRGIVGLGNTSKLDEQVWNEFSSNRDNFIFESEILISKFINEPIENIASIELQNLPEGKEREITIKQRVNQNFFRATVLSSYNSKCCITGLGITNLLEASHIKPWSIDKENRTNPTNGLCLNILHHRAFDSGLFTITKDYKFKVSEKLLKSAEKSINELFVKYEDKSILLPDKFMPSKEFLEWHNKEIFNRIE